MTHDVSNLPHTLEEAKARPGVKRRVAAAVFLLLALAFLGWQIQQAGPRAIGRRLLSVSWEWVLLIVALTLLRYVIASVKLGGITRRLMPVRILPFLPIFLASQILTLLIPGFRVGGTLLRAHLANRRFGGGLASHLGPNLLDHLTLAISWILAAVVFLFVSAAGGDAPFPYRSVSLLLLSLCALALAFALLRRRAPALGRWLSRPRHGWRQRLAVSVQTAAQGTGILAVDARALGIGLGGGLSFVFLTGLTQYVALVAVGESINWWVAMLAVVIGTTAGTVSGTPGGLGVAEASQVAYLQGQGVSLGSATAAVLLARGAYYVFILVAGGLAFGWEAYLGHLRGILLPRRSPTPADHPTTAGHDVAPDSPSYP